MAAGTVWRNWRRKVHDILEVGGDAHPAAHVVTGFIVVLIVLNAIAFAAETVDDLAEHYQVYFQAFNVFSVIVFSIEYALRVWSCVEIPMLSRMTPWRARLKFATRPMMIIDLLAFAPWYVHWIYPIDLRVLRVFRLFRLLKLVRYSPALQTLGRVLADEYRALLGALLIMLVLLLFASTGIYFLERTAQPEIFDSIPSAAWWALATLTTVGYGDVVPITPLGKLLGGVVMLLGVGMFALPIAIIATGFSQEANRHQFVVTWSMVARVPLFATMDQSEIAEITKLLYTRNYLPGVPMVRTGDSGDGMYLIASGEADGRRRRRQASRAEGGRLLRRDGAPGAPPPQARRGRQDPMPGLRARQPGLGAPHTPPSGDPEPYPQSGEGASGGRCGDCQPGWTEDAAAVENVKAERQTQS